ncbi:MAG TPA: tRNA uridine-5-carboxymethylaminomethyl(34) synthesis GTPase MnmE, partial [Sphingomicrobium sp.]|nr:tRNA uridine-5-carboxymethylaminomethyl(34) synthesis GTPase MnmE [Sphingomicrobium sp.]
EDLVEFHCHGGRAVVSAVLATLSRIDGLRPAQPGEFTRRAFESGRIDLIEAEGLADLIEAETESQRRAALMMAEGGPSKRIAAWQERLLELSARAEAAIDYVDEDSIDTEPGLSHECGALAKEVDRWLDQPRAELLREGVRIVIAGPPNAGKSSLLNALVGHDRAIVTEVPGTTRDHIEVSLAFSGVPIRLTDTAGLRESAELVERIGVDRSRGLIDLADILVWLGEAEAAPNNPRLIQVQPRSDLPGRGQAPEGAIAVSSKTGDGLAALGAAIVSEARSLLPAEGQLALNARQADCFGDARDMLRAAESAPDLVILAESLRAARAAFDRLTGRAGVEDLLDSLFGRFCLGK